MDITTADYTVRVHDEGEDGLWASVDELPGVFASGSNMEEVQESLREAIGLYLSVPGSPVQVEMGAAREIERVQKQHLQVC